MTLNNINKGIITARPKRKFRKFPKIDAIGIISFNNAPCFNIGRLFKRESVASDKLREKKIHGNITEKIYLSLFAEREKTPSIHIAEWPKPIPIPEIEEGKLAIELISEFRNEKSKNGIALNAEISRAVIQLPADKQKNVMSVKDDIKETLKIVQLDFTDPSIEINAENTFETTHGYKIGWELKKE